MDSKNKSFLQAFKEAELFIESLDPKKCSSPFLIKTFMPMRTKMYKELASSLSKRENKAIFIEKFENEFVDLLRSKLKKPYAQHILAKQENVPNEVDLANMKSKGAIEEVNQLALAIAEWSLELEIVAYTLEGIELYGFQKFQKEESEDYVSVLKRGYSFQKKTSFLTISEHLIRKIVSLSLNKVSSMAAMGGLARVQLSAGAIFEIFMHFSMTGKIPWAMILKYANLPWVIGGFAISWVFSKLNEYAVQEEMASNLKRVLVSFEENKVSLMSERKKIVEIMDKIVEDGDEKLLKVLSKAVECLLDPVSQEVGSENGEEMYDIKELEDCVLVEEKDHKEKKDRSGVIVVDW